MPTEHASGNLLTADVDVLVNTVNCVGFMGKGIALQFRQAYPSNFEAYQKACKAERVQLGSMFVTETRELTGPKWIINFPTKGHWRARSRLDDIRRGLEALVAEVRERGIRSIAIPPLGCGLGGLNWDDVRPLIEAAAAAMPDVRVVIFAPERAPRAVERVVRTERPPLTPARALFIKLMERYKGLEYELTLLEVQKLAYFLQEAGQPLRLRYEEAVYGPYADNLNKVLEKLEGHYTRGYVGERGPAEEIDLLPGAAEEAERFLADDAAARERLDRVARLIDGFETPYGMELLASLHWLARRRDPPALDDEQALGMLHGWNERKRQVFRADHVKVAWARLEREGWLQSPAAT
jgi:O-acetyl-ADP-ribose deacetylase (regulator of RNase III)